MVKKAFTLIELLIVIGLIGILIAISVTSYGTIQKKSRDTRRINDLKSVQNAFEQFYVNNNSIYPKAAAEISATYLPAGIPKDPKNVNYTILYDGTNGASYCACALLEGTTTGGNVVTLPGSTPCTLSTTGSYFCVKNLQ